MGYKSLAQIPAHRNRPVSFDVRPHKFHPMSTEYINSIAFATAAGVLLLLIRSFLPSYFTEKGKNLATKEDIGEITAVVESVKEDYTKHLKELEHQNNLVLEQLRMNQQLRIAAVEKRLSAHQEAFTLWRRLIASAHDDSLSALVLECQDWWNKNCLYLSAEARDAFNNAYSLALNHRTLAESNRDLEAVRKYSEIIYGAGGIIVAGVQLPSLGVRESSQAPQQ